MTASSAAAELRWLRGAVHWQEFERFEEVTGERESIWLMKAKGSSEVRFYAVGRGLISKHEHVVQATYWAYGNGYLGVCAEPSGVFVELACRAEVSAGGASRPRVEAL